MQRLDKIDTPFFVCAFFRKFNKSTKMGKDDLILVQTFPRERQKGKLISITLHHLNAVGMFNKYNIPVIFSRTFIHIHISNEVLFLKKHCRYIHNLKKRERVWQWFKNIDIFLCSHSKDVTGCGEKPQFQPLCICQDKCQAKCTPVLTCNGTRGLCCSTTASYFTSGWGRLWVGLRESEVIACVFDTREKERW